MTWLGLVLDRLDDKDRKVLINFHIPPGGYYPGKDQTFWTESYTQQFQDIIKRNHKKILLISGAHIHVLDFRYQEEIKDGVPLVYMGIMLTPSFSPEFGNNPGYTTFEVKNGEISNL